ncbi:hypothetical protein DXB57_17320 [Bacteroides fragilis]|nr:hypothetical protein DXB57_17320 [Bacteroides fragilis]
MYFLIKISIRPYLTKERKIINNNKSIYIILPDNHQNQWKSPIYYARIIITFLYNTDSPHITQ